MDEFKAIVFRLHNEEMAISINNILFIEKMLEVTSVPGVDDYIKGITTVRESTIPIIDLRQYLYEVPVEENENTRVIVVHNENKTAGLIVDEATEILDIKENKTKELFISKLETRMQVCQVEERLIILIDVEKLLDKVDIERFINRAEMNV